VSEEGMVIEGGLRNKTVRGRVVRSEICGGKFPHIYSDLSRNFQKIVKCLCQSAISKSCIAQ